MPSSPDNKTGKGTWKNENRFYKPGGETREQEEARKQLEMLENGHVGFLRKGDSGPVLPDGPSLGRTANGSKKKSGKRSEPPSGH